MSAPSCRSSSPRRSRSGGALVLCVILTAATPAAEAPDLQPVALALSVRGAVTVVDGPAEPAVKPLARLHRGTVLRTGADAELVLVFETGERFRVGPSSLVAVEAQRVTTSTGKIEPLLPVPAVVELWPLLASPDKAEQAAAARIRNAAGTSASALTPDRGTFVDAERLTLRFAPVSEAERYAVRLEDAASGELLFAAVSERTLVTVPSGKVPPGRLVYWEVEAAAEGRRLGREAALFSTLPADAEQAEHALREQAKVEPELGLLVAALERVVGDAESP